MCSAVNLDCGFSDVFDKEKDGSEDEDDIEYKDNNDAHEAQETEDVKYGEIKLKSLLFQDDIMTPSKSPESAQITNNKIEKIMESKLLELHRDKTCYIVVGALKARKKLEKELEKSP